jgi:hypothetical protein
MEWMYSSNILNLGTRWRTVLNFTPRQLFLRETHLRCLFNKRLGWPQSRSGRCGEEKSCHAENQTQAFQLVVRLYTD